ncbi:MAG: M23 family metallopeptidase [Bacilli bacterium]|nr:M23 family metallopeptidase [Bacilli bacterium]
MIAKKKRVIIRMISLSLIAITFLGLAVVNNYVVNKYKNQLYVKDLLKEPTQQVYNEVSNQTNIDEQVIIPPYVGDDITDKVLFYDKDDTEDIQKKAIIQYESTYLPSTGILYTSDNAFDVIAVCDGEVIKVEKDNILGNHIAIRHNNNLITHYYSITDTELKEKDLVTQGQILGTSSKNKISRNEYNLFFEVSYQNENINPNIIYNQKITNFS